MFRFALKFLCVLIFVAILVCSADRLAGTPNMALFANGDSAYSGDVRAFRPGLYDKRP